MRISGGIGEGAGAFSLSKLGGALVGVVYTEGVRVVLCGLVMVFMHVMRRAVFGDTMGYGVYLIMGCYI